MATTRQQAITSLDDYDDLVEGYIERGETDGFPIVPPYPAGVDALVAGSGRAANAVLGRFARRPAPISVRDIAEQSLMAGWPEYMPLVIAAFEILLEPEFGTDRWAASDGGYFPWVLVNGPIRAQFYQDAQTRLVQTSPFVFLYNYNKFDAAYQKVKGVVYNPQTKQWRELRDFWLDS
jgi:hypothetical protein